MAWQILWETVAIALLFVPAVWEVWNDQDGDDHSSKADLYARAGLVITCSMVIWLITGRSGIRAALLCTAFHFMIFDYWVAYKLEKNGVIKPGSCWFTYLSKSAPYDKAPLWQRLGPWGRLVTRIVVLAITLTIYLYETY
jgi:hypothetical protein